MTTLTMGGVVGEYAALDELLFESEGEITPEIEALLAELDEKAQAKIERVALYILGQQGKAKAIKEEESRIGARRQALERGAVNLKAYLERTMREIGTTKVDGLLVTVAIQKNPPSVVVGPEWDEPAIRSLAQYAPAYVTHTPETFAMNKRAILDAAKAGQTIPENVTVTQGESLRIR